MIRCQYKSQEASSKTLLSCDAEALTRIWCPFWVTTDGPRDFCAEHVKKFLSHSRVTRNIFAVGQFADQLHDKCVTVKSLAYRKFFLEAFEVHGNPYSVLSSCIGREKNLNKSIWVKADDMIRILGPYEAHPEYFDALARHCGKGTFQGWQS